MARIDAVGRRRRVSAGEVLLDPRRDPPRLFVVVSGSIRLEQLSDPSSNVLALDQPSTFSGEANLLTGRRGLAARAFTARVGDELTGCLCRRRRPLRQREASGVGRQRRSQRSNVRP
jgi:CRP-like cAMP-binding protein